MYRLKVTAAIALLVAALLGLTAVMYWASQRVDRDLRRSAFAHDQLEAYLRLSHEAYRHFKQQADMLLTGAVDGPRQLEASQARVDAIFQQLEADTKDEFLFLDDEEEQDEEWEERDRNAKIKAELAAIAAEFETVRTLIESGDEAAARARLHSLLDEQIDGRFADLIADAIADESEEMQRSDDDAHTLLSTMALAARVSAPVVVVLALLLGIMLIIRVTRPLERLLDGTQRLAAGELSHRIRGNGNDEFSQLGRSFNQMADQLESRTRELTQSHQDLEKRVRERTDELNAANQALERTARLRQQFLADISHELRTPLTVIRGEAEVSLRGDVKTAADYEQALARIARESEQLGRLVDDLLLVARSQVGEVRLSMTAVAMPQLIAEICEGAETLANQKGTLLTYENRCQSAVVTADRWRLHQLFHILIDNALRYSSDGGSVAIISDNHNESIRIRVIDCGIGIAPDELDGVFERFYRGRLAREMAPDGAGLGLPVAKAIVDAHRGSIRIDSERGKGSTVTIKLPAVRRARPAA